MAKLRKARAYRRFERPYTRVSKFREKSFVRMTLNTRITRFDMGNLKKGFPYKITIVSKRDIQIRDNALESARQTSNRIMEKTAGLAAYNMKLRPYPHHVLRENPLATGAGADRFSTGMQKSFGKPIGQAVRLRKGQALFEINTTKNNLNIAKKAMKRAYSKLPNSFTIVVAENKQNINTT